MNLAFTSYVLRIMTRDPGHRVRDNAAWVIFIPILFKPMPLIIGPIHSKNILRNKIRKVLPHESRLQTRRISHIQWICIWFKGELHPKPKLGMLRVLPQNEQHCFAKYYRHDRQLQANYLRNSKIALKL